MDEKALAAKFLPILRDIQKKLYIVLGAGAVGAVGGFVYYQKILNFILKSFNLKGITIVLTNPYQFFDLAVNTGLTVGVCVALPLLIFFALTFLKPALKHHEFSLLLRLTPISLILFVAGFIFGAWIMQFVVSIYSQTTVDFNVSNFWDIGHFFAQILILGLCMGLVFQLPVVITILLRLGVIKKTILASKRKFVYAGILVFAAILPPNDIISLSILTLVPLFLFEVALLLN